MNSEIKAKWLAALRSGEYKQGTEQLCTLGEDHLQDNRYCCLGVLAQLVDPERRTWHSYDGYFASENADSCREVQYDLVGGGISARAAHELVSMNDDAGSSFAVIADYIEANIE